MEPSERICLIYNPRAGAINDLPLMFAKKHGWGVYSTTKETRARALAKQAIADGYTRLVAAGGDGTISDVLDGMANHLEAVELAVVPLGTGNDFSRTLGIPLSNPALCLDIARRGGTTAVDIGRFEGQDEDFFVNAVSGGFGGEVTATANEGPKQVFGAFTYWITAATKAISPPVYRLGITHDGDTTEIEAYGISVANGRFVGGGFPIAPDASVRDGLLDIVIMPVMPTFDRLSTAFTYMMDSQELPAEVIHIRAKNIHIESEPAICFSIDGEPQRVIHADIEVLPKALKIATGPV